MGGHYSRSRSLPLARSVLVGIHRSLKRRHLIYYLRVFDLETGEAIGHLVDLTVRGMMVISEEPVTTDKVFRMKMDLPPQLFEKERWELTARSIWCKPDVNPSFHDTGLRFLATTRHDEMIIHDLIEHYGLND